MSCRRKHAIYYTETMRTGYRKGGHIIRDPNGWLFSLGQHPTKIKVEDLPEWYVHVYLYKQWSYLRAEGVKYLQYKANEFTNHMFKDDVLYISYKNPIVPSSAPWTWYEGHDVRLYGGSIIQFIIAVDKYSPEVDTMPVKEAIEKKRLWLKEHWPDDYESISVRNHPYFDEQGRYIEREQ